MDKIELTEAEAKIVFTLYETRQQVVAEQDSIISALIKLLAKNYGFSEDVNLSITQTENGKLVLESKADKQNEK